MFLEHKSLSPCVGRGDTAALNGGLHMCCDTILMEMGMNVYSTQRRDQQLTKVRIHDLVNFIRITYGGKTV